MDEYGVLTAPDTLRLERLLPGPIERIWAYLTDGRKRGEWLASGEMELRVGGRVEHIFRNGELTSHVEATPAKYGNAGEESRMEGRITACEPPRLLGYTWSGEPGEDSEVTFELTPRAEMVLLVVTHRGIGKRDLLVGVAGGWHTHLGILAARLEGREPAAFWATHMRLEAEYEQRIPGAGDGAAVAG